MNISENRGLAHNISYSYGLLFNIPLNKKMKFRFGFNSLKFKYSFKDLSSGINENGQPSLLNMNNIETSRYIFNSNIKETIASGGTFDLEHRVHYWEFPFEITYALKDNGIVVDLIGGLDLWVLQGDEILLSAKNTTRNIGKANYLKKTTISTHAGLGFRYNLTDYLRIDVEPTLKYQFGNQNQYYFSIYSGLTIKL